MKSRYWLPGALLAMSAGLMPLAPARADVVLADSVGFIKGTQIFTDSFTVSTPGVLTVTLTAIPWLDTLQDLNCFLSSPGGLFSSGSSASGALPGPAVSGTTAAAVVQAGVVSVNWYGTAAGTFNVGVYSINVDFRPNATAVPVPAALPLLLSGLGLLSVWGRKRQSKRLVG